MSSSPALQPNDLEAFWLPFTANRAFKKRPRLVARSKDMHYYTPEGRPVLDATASIPASLSRVLGAHRASLAVGSPSLWRRVVPACCATATIGPFWIVLVQA